MAVLAAQAPKQLSIYRVAAVVGKTVVTLHSTGWTDTDALHRISRRLNAEGHTFFTLQILDSKEIQ